MDILLIKLKKLTTINSGSVIRIDLRLITPKANAHTRKDGNVLFNDALNTFYLRLYGVGHMVKDHSDSERKRAAATWATLSD